MNPIQSILQYNKQFVANKEYEAYRTDKFPNKRMVIITCMDTRLVELLPRAMNLRNGDAKVIKNAGAIISQPFGSVMRSVLVALYELEADEVVVVGHHECGMAALNSGDMIQHMIERGIDPQVLNTLEHSGIKLTKWLHGFDNVEDGVKNTVTIIKNHPLLPPSVPVHGMVIHSETGALELIVDGYES